MKNTFVVLDGENAQTWNGVNEVGETFTTFAAAEKRAKQVAKDDPGTVITIFEAVATVSTTVSEPITKIGE